MEVTFGQGRTRILAGDRFPCSVVPQHDGAAAILALGDGALEPGIVERMVLGPHSQPLVIRIGTGPARDGPAQENAVQLQSEIIV